MAFAFLLFRLFETVPDRVGYWHDSGSMFFIRDLELFKSYSILFFESYVYMDDKLKAYGIKRCVTPDGVTMLYGIHFQRKYKVLRLENNPNKKRKGSPLQASDTKRAMPPLALPSPVLPLFTSDRVCNIHDKPDLFDPYVFVFGEPEVDMDVASAISEVCVNDPYLVFNQPLEPRQHT